MGSDPVRQHFVPKVYLRGFCADLGKRDQIHVRDLATGRNFLSALDRVAVKRHFYTLPPGTPLASFAVEQWFSTLETKAQPVLEEIRTGQCLPDGDESMRVLSTFVATLHLRTRQGLQIVQGHQADVRAGNRTGYPETLEGERYVQDLLQFGEEEMRQLFARSAVVVGQRIGETLRAMKWRLLQAAPGTYFITSENPVFSYHPTELRWGLGTPGVHIMFPVSPSILIHISPGPAIPGSGTFNMPAQGVRGINGLAMEAAEQFLYSHRPFEEVQDLINERETGTKRGFGPAGASHLA